MSVRGSTVVASPDQASSPWRSCRRSGSAVALRALFANDVPQKCREVGTSDVVELTVLVGRRVVHEV